jgi:hypothetical protein
MAAFILTSNSCLWDLNTDSHEDIIKKYNLNDKTISPDFIRVELVPPDHNYSLPLKEWKFVVDQDYLPEWFNKKEAEKATRRELKNWAQAKIIRNQTVEEEEDKNYGDKNRIFIDCKVSISGQTGGGCWFYGQSTGKVSNQKGGDCWFYGQSTGEVSDQKGGYCLFLDKSTGKVSDQKGGNCWFYGQSTGKVSDQKGGVCLFCGQSSGKVSDQKGGSCSFFDQSTGKVSDQKSGNCWFYDQSTGKVSNQKGGGTVGSLIRVPNSNNNKELN